jgi:AcrR family transcriptional regulator
VERILDTAARIFDERGYRQTTTNLVAEAAGVSIGSLYQYFPNKDALLVALAERHLEEASSVLGAELVALREQAPPIDVVVRRLVESTVSLNDTSRLHAVLFTDCPRTPALTERLDALTDAAAEEVAHHLHRLHHGGPDAHRRATLLVAMVDAGAHHVVRTTRPGPSRRTATAELVDLVTNAVR